MNHLTLAAVFNRSKSSYLEVVLYLLLNLEKYRIRCFYWVNSLKICTTEGIKLKVMKNAIVYMAHIRDVVDT